MPKMVLHRMNVSIESAVNYQLGERNEDMDAYAWCLVVSFARKNLKRTGNFHYLGNKDPFKTSLVFPGPGASNGRDADTGDGEDFEQWEREMLETGSPLYRAFVEVMQKYGKVGDCMYCRSGVTYDSYVCDSCAKEWNWDGCRCCGDFLGKLTDAGVHENCEE